MHFTLNIKLLIFSKCIYTSVLYNTSINIQFSVNKVTAWLSSCAVELTCGSSHCTCFYGEMQQLQKEGEGTAVHRVFRSCSVGLLIRQRINTSVFVSWATILSNTTNQARIKKSTEQYIGISSSFHIIRHISFSIFTEYLQEYLFLHDKLMQSI